MSLTKTNTYDAIRDDVSAQPELLVELETTVVKSEVTTQAEWEGGSDVDIDTATKPGNIFIEANKSEYTVVSLSVDDEDHKLITGSDDALAVRIQLARKTKISEITLRMRYVNASTCNVTCKIHPIESENYPKSGDSVTLKEEVSGSSVINALSGLMTDETFDFGASGIELDTGIYYFVFTPIFTGGAGSENIEWEVDLQTNKTVKDIDTFNIMRGIAFDFGTVTHAVFTDYTEPTTDTPESQKATLGIPVIGGGFHRSYNDFDDNMIPVKSMKVFGYGTTGNLTTDWLAVKDVEGTAVTPTEDGILRVFGINPFNTTVTVELRGANDGVGTGDTLIGASMSDGDAITQLFPYYKFKPTLSTTDWFSTPELSSIQAYFPTVKKFTKSLMQARMGNYDSIVNDIPSYGIKVDPKTAKASIDQLQINIVSSRSIKSNSIVEDLFDSNYFINNMINVKFGFKGLSEGDFIADQKAWINNYSMHNNVVKLVGEGGLEPAKGFGAGFDDISAAEGIYYNLENPTDIMLDMLSRLSIRESLINDSSFSTVKTNHFSNWQFFKPFNEGIDNVKSELDDMSQLMLATVVRLEDGQIYLIKFDDDSKSVSATFTPDNSILLNERIDLNLNSRVNTCSVQRGYWDEGDYEKDDRNFNLETVANADAINDLGGIIKTETIKNEYVPSGVLISGDELAEVIATNRTNLFGYGVWRAVVETSNEFRHLQIGDIVNYTTDKIFFKDFVRREVTVRTVIVGKEPQTSSPQRIKWDLWIYQNITAEI